VNVWLLFALVIVISLGLAVGAIVVANRLTPSSIGKEQNSTLSQISESRRPAVRRVALLAA
jgi:hypothetical protein